MSAPSLEASLPLGVRILDAADRIARRAGLLRRPLSAMELIRAAQRATGLADFGEQGFEAALDMLLRSCEAEAGLSAFGRMAMRWDALRFLSNLLLLREAETRMPAILGQRIERPIFIIGMPRSGTTFLHSLLAADPFNRVARCWETIYPCVARENAARLARFKVDLQLAGFTALTPEFRSLHPITAVSPQECTEITGHVFMSCRFDTTHEVPSYRRWLDRTGHLAAFRFHKRFLQHLQHRKGPGRWVLKCPDHVFALDAIRSIYPDAGFVVMHRNPVEVLASVARLTEILRLPFARRVDRRQIGRQVSEQWALGAEILTKAGRGSGAEDSVFHVKFASFVADPVGCVAALYDRFGMSFDEAAAARVRTLVAAHPNGGYGRNKGRLEDYGLDAGTERRRYRDYQACFDV
jgi:hypothetical protein